MRRAGPSTGLRLTAAAGLVLIGMSACRSTPNTPAAPKAAVAPAGAAAPVSPPPAPVPAPPPHGVIAGRIIDVTSRAPLARARVVLSADCEAPAAPNAPPCAKVLPQNRVALTDADGRYRLTDLPVGTTFVLRAGHTGYAPAAYKELPPGTPPAYLSLAAEQVLDNIDIELARDVVLSGVVQDEDGSPFAGALVEAQRAFYADGRRQLVSVSESLTDDRGQFRLSQMPPGQYYLVASDPAFADVGDAQGQLFYTPTYYPDATSPEDAGRITVDAGANRDGLIIKLRIIRPSRVGGMLHPAMGAQLVAGAIELGPKRNDQYASLSNFRVDIHPDGSYMFANVPPGRYVIRARGETSADVASMFGLYTLEVSGVDKTAVDVELSPGALLEGFVEWQGRSAPPADKKAIVVRAPMTDGSLSGDAVTGNIQPDNAFRLKGVLQGLHYLRVEGLPAPWSLKRVELNGADVTDIPVDYRYGQIEKGLRLIFTDVSTTIVGTINLGRGDVLQGYAVIAFSANPTAWYPRSREVALRRPIDATGRYAIQGLPPGDYFVAVTRDLDEGDIANAKAIQLLSQSGRLARVQIREGETKLLDLRPLPGAVRGAATQTP